MEARFLAKMTTEQDQILRNLTNIPINRSSAAGINLRDAIRREDLETGIPAQFVVEEVDCRLFWTPEMIGDVSAIWTAAAKAAWGDGHCVAGNLPKRDLEERAARHVASQEEVQKRGTKVVRMGPAPERDEMWQARHGMKGPL